MSPRVRAETAELAFVDCLTRLMPESERVAAAPGEFPDPLLETAATVVAPGRTESFWIDVRVPPAAAAGRYLATVTAQIGATARQLPLALEVHPAVVPVRRTLRLTNWFSVNPRWLGYADAPPLSVNWWRTVEAIARSCWGHRQNVFWTSLDDWMIPRRVGPDGGLALDFSHFDRWVQTFSHPDFETFIEGQPITTRDGYDGHIRAPVWRVEEGAVKREIVEVDSPAAAAWFATFLTALRQHLAERGCLDRFLLHLADEPHGHQLAPYAKLVEYVRAAAPDLRIVEALDVRDDYVFFQDRVDVWVP